MLYGGVLAPERRDRQIDRSFVLPTRANTSDSEKALPTKHAEQKRVRELERAREGRRVHIYMSTYACNLENEGDSPVSDGRTYRPDTKETRGASMVSSTPGISLIRLGTRFECSLSLSTIL